MKVIGVLTKGFNPTLVRLRRAMAWAVMSSVFGFNPTLVRLRRPGRTAAPPVSGPFQSHAGSIEAADGEAVRNNKL